MHSTLRLLFTTLVLVLYRSETVSAAQWLEPPVGRLSREKVAEIIKTWGGGDFSLDPRWKDAIQDLKRVPRGATVKVFLGVWCDDSKREIPQFMRILELLDDQTPFTVEFFAVDEQKRQPVRDIEANTISSVPTFIVIRNGHEVGRIVEQPARTLERDLLRLLNGTARGLLSSNENAIVQYLTTDQRD